MGSDKGGGISYRLLRVQVYEKMKTDAGREIVRHPFCHAFVEVKYRGMILLCEACIMAL